MGRPLPINSAPGSCITRDTGDDSWLHSHEISTSGLFFRVKIGCDAGEQKGESQ
jgi:hypothetical protein